MKPYSLDLRERVRAAVEQGDLTQPQIAEKYDVSLRTVETWARQWRETGSVAPKSHSSGPPRTLQACEAIIRQALRTQPDLTLAELCGLVASQARVRGSASMMCRELQHLHLPRKKVATRQSTRNGARSKNAPNLSRPDDDHASRHRRTPQIHR